MTVCTAWRSFLRFGLRCVRISFLLALRCNLRAALPDSRVRNRCSACRVASRCYTPQAFGAPERLSVRTADEFVSSAYTYPSLMANEFGWSLEDFTVARQKFVGQLRGHVAGGILAPVPLSDYSYGAVGSRSIFQSFQPARRRPSAAPAAPTLKRKSPKSRHKASLTAGPKPLGLSAHGEKAR